MQVVVIEPDEKCYAELKEALVLIDSEIEILRYLNLVKFYDALQAAAKNEQDMASISINLSHIALLIADFKVTKSVDVELWKKIVHFIRSKQDPEEIPTRLLLSAYVDAENKIDFEAFYDPVIFNVLVKPFDKLLLRQYLDISLNSQGKIEAKNLYGHTTKQAIEIIKDISLDRLTELGFRTYSSRPIPVGKIARYYGEVFSGPKGNSVFAYCYKNVEVKESQQKLYHSSFSFFGIAKEQLSSIRRLIQGDKKKIKLELETEENPNIRNRAIVLSKNSATSSSVKNILQEKFSNLEVIKVPDISVLAKLLPSKITNLSASMPVLFDNFDPVRMVYDEKMEKILDVFKDKEEIRPTKVFLQEMNKITEEMNFLSLIVDEENKKDFKEIQKTKILPSKCILKLKIKKNEEVYIKLFSLTKSFNKSLGKEVYVLKLQQCTEKEVSLLIRSRYKDISSVSLVFLDLETNTTKSLGALKNMIEMLNKGVKMDTKFMAIQSAFVSHYEQISLLQGFDDIFLVPLETFYLTKKIKMHCPNLLLREAEDNFRYSIRLESGIKTAQPVQPKSVSEVHISFYHNRKLKVGKMRNIVLWIPNVAEMPEVTTMCRFSEEQEKSVYLCEFLLFGVHEYELKYIRQWMKETYANEKQIF